MIQSYPVIMLPFASLLQWLATRKIWAVVATPFILLFLYVNIWFTANAHGWPGLYDPEGMSRAYYRAVIGRWHVSSETEKLKDTRHIYEGILHRKQLVFSTGYETADTMQSSLPPINGRSSAFVDGQHQFSAPAGFRYQGDWDWIRVQATIRIGQKEWNMWNMTQMKVFIFHRQQLVKEEALRPHRFLSDQDIKSIHLDIRLAGQEVDSISILLWNADGQKPMQMDDVAVWGYYEK